MDRNKRIAALQCHFCKKFLHKHEALEFQLQGEIFHAHEHCIDRELINKDKIKTEKLTLTAIPFEEEFSANGRCYWCKEPFKTAFDSPIVYVKDLPDQIVIDDKKHLIHQECLAAKKLMETIEGEKQKEFQGSSIYSSFPGYPSITPPPRKKQDPEDVKRRIANLMKKFPK